jgi:hypothetical protein
VRSILAKAMLTLGAILTVAWVGLIIVMAWWLIDLAS